MKKLLLLASLLLLFYSCEDDKENITTEDLELELKVGKSYLPEGNGFKLLEAPDYFIADWEDGKISARHVGVTTLKFQTGSTIYNCKVDVAANNTLYIDMKYLLGQPRSFVEILYGSPVSENEDTFVYKNLLLEEGNVFIYEYGEVAVASIIFANSYSASINKHLSDRYEYYTTRDGNRLYGDALDFAEAEVVVMTQTQGNLIFVIYTTKSFVSDDTRAFFPENLFPLI